MRGSRKFCQRGSNSTLTRFFKFYLVDEGKEDPNTTKGVPSSALQGNAISIVFPRQADNGQTLNAGLVAFFQGIGTSIAKKPYTIGL